MITSPSGVDFDQSFARRESVVWDGIKVPLIGFADLKRNKAASGRPKDLADLANLLPRWPWKAPRPPSKRRRNP